MVELDIDGGCVLKIDYFECIHLRHVVFGTHSWGHATDFILITSCSTRSC